MDRPDLLGRKFFPDEAVAAAAVVTASLPGGDGIRQDLADHDTTLTRSWFPRRILN